MTSNTQNNIAATYVQLIVDYIQQQRLPVDTLSQYACFEGIDLSAQTQSHLTFIPREQLLAMLDAVKSSQPKAFSGIEMGKLITASHYGVLGYVLLACSNLGTALARVDKYARIVDQSYFMQVHRYQDQLEIHWPLTPNETYHALFAEVGVSNVVQFARNMTNRPLRVNKVAFSHSPLVDESIYQQFFKGEVLFNQPEVYIQFDSEYLGLPLRRPDKVLLDILESQACLALDRLPKQEQFLRRVQAIMMTFSRDSLPTLDMVAAELNMSPRTLQRKLSKYDMAYQVLLDNTQQHLAEQYLADERLRLIEIAHLLGYSDQSAFTRAFKRWLNMTPKAYRQRLLTRKSQQR